ncbi:MAG: protein kinase [Phycisphaerae bacterium]|nr:protein kinase [Phycisphaerae bacterium]NUQ46098.1 protein kinase [Phycisphaerae bacterium]
MSDPRWERIKAIFLAASAMSGPARAAYLDRECGEDAALRREVESLLDARPDARIETGAGRRVVDDVADETQTLPMPPDDPGGPIGPYHLLQRIGEGGFGEVWVAEQKSPVRRKVALKIVKAGMDTREVLARFEAERQALAVMDHPNVAKVFDAGATENGRPYFVMEHVPGLPITDFCDTSRLRIKDRLRLFVDICQAVQHAHQKGIIHRDLKPSNILVTLLDGRPVPKVIDFGIAKAAFGRLTERTLYTETGRLMGTPEYMAPEQAGTTGLDVDTRVDIYSLGVILYQLLTGTLPFDAQTLRGAGFDGLAKIIREQEPPKPSTRLSTLATEAVNRQNGATPESIARTHGADFRALQRELRGDLDWITLKALEKDRARRYESAAALAADVQRHLSGEPVVAAPPSAGYRARKFVRKHRGPVLAASAVMAALLVGIAGISWQARRTTAANKRLNTWVGQALDGMSRIYAASAAQAVPVAKRAEDGTLVPLVPSFSVRGFDAIGARHGVGDDGVTFDDPGEALDYLIRLSIENANVARKMSESLKQQRDAAELEAYAARLAGAQMAMAANAWAEARDLLEACPQGKRGWEWEFLKNQAEAIRWSRADTCDAQFSPDGSKIITLSTYSAVRVIEATTGAPIGKPLEQRQQVRSATFSPDGLRIATATADNNVWIWNAETGEPSYWPIPHSSEVVSCAFSPDGQRILTVTNGKRLVPVSAAGWTIESSDDIAVRVFDLAGKRLAEVKQPEPPTAAVFVANSRRVMTASPDGHVRFWNADDGSPVGPSLRHVDSVQSAECRRDGKAVLTVTNNPQSDTHRHVAWLWDLAPSEPVARPLQHQSAIVSVAFSSDGSLLLTVTNGERERERSSDNWIVERVDDIAVRIFDRSGQITAELKHAHQVNSAVFSPDSRFVLTASQDGLIRLWRVTGELAGFVDLSEQGAASDVTHAFFSPDGRMVVVGMRERMFALSASRLDWPVLRLEYNVDAELAHLMIGATEKPMLRGDEARTTDAAAATNGPDPPPDHHAGKPAATLSPDGMRRVRLGADASVRFVDANANRELVVFRLPTKPVSARFTPDGTRLVLVLPGARAVLWDARDPDARRADRNARHEERRPAERYVDALISGPTPLDQCEHSIRNDGTLSAMRRLVCLEVLYERTNAIETQAREYLDGLTRTHITPTRVAAAAAASKSDLSGRAWEALQRKVQEWKPDAGKLNDLAWEAVKNPDESSSVIAAALEAARLAVAAEPSRADFANTLGAALYRDNRFAEALEILTSVNEQLKTANSRGLMANLAFTAMSYARLGRRDEALAALDRLKQSLAAADRIEGLLDGRRLTFRFTEEGDFVGEGWFELAEDGRTFQGLWRYYGESSWDSWWGKRRGDGAFSGFDGLWIGTYGDMYLHTFGDAVMGWYGMTGFALEALMLIEG